MSDTMISAERVLPCSRSRVWSLLADPDQHHRFDATGMVGALASTAPQAVGDVFRMHMTWRDGDTVEHYQSDNHVLRYVAGEVISWATALPDGEPLGWTWTHELIDGAAGARVRLTYDWSQASPANIRRFGVPLTDHAGLASSLELLEQACCGS